MNLGGSAYSVVWFWMDEDGHKENILNNDWVDIGVGMSEARSGMKYWCVKFARPYEMQELVLTEDELGELFWFHFEDSMKRNQKPNLESLEGRKLLTQNVLSTLANGTLAIVGTNQADSIRVSNPSPTTVQLDIKGQVSQTFSSTAVTKLVVNGLNGNDSIINLTQIPSVIVDGNGDNYIDTGLPSQLGTGANDVIQVGNGNNVIQDSGGTDTFKLGNGNNVLFSYGTDNIVAGNGNNVLYNIVGKGTITAGNGNNQVITNANFLVNTGPNSAPVYNFTQPQDAVTLAPNGVLYFRSSTGAAAVDIEDNGDGTITTVFTDGATGATTTQSFLKSSVIQIGAIFGKGSGTFVNNTNLNNVVYGGSAGGNILIGGGGSFDFQKSNSPNDIIIGNSPTLNVLSVGGQNGTLIGSTGNNVFAAGFSGNATVLSTGAVDVVIGDISVGSILAANKTKVYN